MNCSTHRFLCMLLILTALSSCAIRKPDGFTYLYENKNTGLEKRININGYYVAHEKCDNDGIYTIFMFYPNGLLMRVCTTDSSANMLKVCFEKGVHTSECQFPTWGVYRIAGDTIKTQLVQAVGSMSDNMTLYRDFIILPNGNIAVETWHRHPQTAMIDYSKDLCLSIAQFYPVTAKRDPSECPWINFKWFWKEE